MLETRIRIVGVGGQGIVRASIILGLAATIEGKYASQSQAYGAEVTGTATVGDAVNSSNPIKFPYIEKANIMMCLHDLGWKIYRKTLESNGLVIYDSILAGSVKLELENNINSYGLPLVSIAEEVVGNRIVANIVALGILSKLTNLVSINSLSKAIRLSFERNWELQINALKAGYDYASRQL